MRDFKKRVSPASSVAAYRFASLLADRLDAEAAAVLATADLEELAIVLVGALSAAFWQEDPHGYRDKLRRLAAAELDARQKDLV